MPGESPVALQKDLVLCGLLLAVRGCSCIHYQRGPSPLASPSSHTYHFIQQANVTDCSLHLQHIAFQTPYGPRREGVEWS